MINIELWEGVFSHKNAALEPESKIVLLGWPTRNGTLVSVDQAQLAGHTGIPDRKLSGIVRQLIEVGWVTSEHGRRRRRSAPLTVVIPRVRNDAGIIQKYLHPEILAAVADSKRPLGGLRPQYEAESCGDNPLDDKAEASPHKSKLLLTGDVRRSRLSFAGRLLLAALWSRADHFGRVASLSQKDLMELTGLTEARLKYQLNKLKELGYIYSSVPGHKGCELFNPCKTTFFLNLIHPALENQFPILISCFKFPAEERWSISGITLKHLAAHASNSHYLKPLPHYWLGHGFPHVARSKELIPAFKALNRNPIFVRIFQARLDDCVSFILTNHWHCFDPEGNGVDDVDLQAVSQPSLDAPEVEEIPELRRMIEESFPSRRYCKQIKSVLAASDTAASFDPELLRAFLYRLSLYLAWRIKELLMLTPRELSEQSHMVLPRVKGLPRPKGHYLTVISRGPAIIESGISLYESPRRATLNSAGTYKCISDVPAEWLYFALLQAAPNSSRTAR